MSELERLRAELSTARALLEEALEELTCGEIEADGWNSGHWCGGCDEYVDRNMPFRKKVRAFLAPPLVSVIPSRLTREEFVEARERVSPTPRTEDDATQVDYAELELRCVAAGETPPFTPRHENWTKSENPVTCMPPMDVRDTDYCAKCGDSPESGAHYFDHNYEGPHGDATDGDK